MPDEVIPAYDSAMAEETDLVFQPLLPTLS